MCPLTGTCRCSQGRASGSSCGMLTLAGGDRMGFDEGNAGFENGWWVGGRENAARAPRQHRSLSRTSFGTVSRGPCRARVSTFKQSHTPPPASQRQPRIPIFPQHQLRSTQVPQRQEAEVPDQRHRGIHGRGHHGRRVRGRLAPRHEVVAGRHGRPARLVKVAAAGRCGVRSRNGHFCGWQGENRERVVSEWRGRRASDGVR